MDKWGKHLIIDARHCDVDKATDKEYITLWVKTLVAAINMKAHGEPQVVHFANHNIDLAGYTVVQLIETSSITAHFCDKAGDAYIDIFSCQDFDVDTVKEVIQTFFNPEYMKTICLDRDA